MPVFFSLSLPVNVLITLCPVVSDVHSTAMPLYSCDIYGSTYNLSSRLPVLLYIWARSVIVLCNFKSCSSYTTLCR